MTQYTFGDGARAARRLALLARVFDAPSRAFLEAWGLRGCGLALDLATLRPDDRELADALARIARDGGDAISWGLRQVVIQAR